MNGTDMGEMKVLRGKKNHKDVGKVVAYNGDTEPDAWDEEECNTYVGMRKSPKMQRKSEKIHFLSSLVL